jgi:hypothetical protein
MSLTDICKTSSQLLDDSDIAERTEDLRYTRSALGPGPVYTVPVGPLVWSCYEAFDEEEGLECHWHKVNVEGPGNFDGLRGKAESDDASTTAIDSAFQQLKAWQKHKHELLLECASPKSDHCETMFYTLHCMLVVCP